MFTKQKFIETLLEVPPSNWNLESESRSIYSIKITQIEISKEGLDQVKQKNEELKRDLAGVIDELVENYTAFALTKQQITTRMQEIKALRDECDNTTVSEAKRVILNFN